MSETKNIIIAVFILILFSMPSFAIEAIQEATQSFSGSLMELSDFTGEGFFKSAKQLKKEREDKINQERADYYHNFVPTVSPYYNYQSGKTMPPVKKLRLKISRSYKNHLEEKAERKAKKAASKSNNDENSINNSSNLSEFLDDEDSVAEEEKNLIGNKEIIIKCKVMKYLPESNDIEATGDLSITFPERDTVIYGKRMTYNNYTNIIQIFDDVKIVRGGLVTDGDYLKFNLNEESGILDNIKLREYDIKLIAERGYMFGDTVITEKGKIRTEHDEFVTFSSEGFSSDILKTILMTPEDYKYLLNDIGVSKFFITVNEINIKANGSSDVIQLKRPKIYNTKGKKLVSLPSMTIYTNKEHDFFEGNYPELGSLPSMGMYVGPGLVIPMPFGSTLKLLPTINYKSGLGFGGIARFRSGTNLTSFAYNTAASRFYLRGEQQLDDYLTLQYNANSYMNSWFLGQEWIGAGAQLAYERGYRHDDFLYNGADLSFNHRISAGYLKENHRSANNDWLFDHTMSTLRFRYQAQAYQQLYSRFRGKDLHDLKGWKQFDFGVVTEGSATLYGTGDTQFIGRVGPRLSTQYRKWKQDIGYYLSGYSDNTPMPFVDAYRYGRSNAYLREYLRVCKYLTLGVYTSYSFDDGLRDYQAKSDTKFKEASFYVALGPDDFKLNLGYDFIRENTYFGFTIAMNPKGTEIDYGKMTIKNYDDIGKAKGEQNVFKSYGFVPPPSPYKSYAVIENLEDATTIMPGENL